MTGKHVHVILLLHPTEELAEAGNACIRREVRRRDNGETKILREKMWTNKKYNIPNSNKLS